MPHLSPRTIKLLEEVGAQRLLGNESHLSVLERARLLGELWAELEVDAYTRGGGSVLQAVRDAKRHAIEDFGAARQ